MRVGRGIGLLLILLASLAVHEVQAQTTGIPAALLDQIRALDEEKAARTPAERKISSHLLHADRMRRGVPIARGIAALRTFVEIAPDGTTLVDVRADVTPSLIQRISDLGGTVLHSSAQLRSVRARLPIA